MVTTTRHPWWISEDSIFGSHQYLWPYVRSMFSKFLSKVSCVLWRCFSNIYSLNPFSCLADFFSIWFSACVSRFAFQAGSNALMSLALSCHLWLRSIDWQCGWNLNLPCLVQDFNHILKWQNKDILHLIFSHFIETLWLVLNAWHKFIASLLSQLCGCHCWRSIC